MTQSNQATACKLLDDFEPLKQLREDLPAGKAGMTGHKHDLSGTHQGGGMPEGWATGTDHGRQGGGGALLVMVVLAQHL